MTDLIGRLSHVTMYPPPPSPIVHELVRARSAFTVANQGNAQKKNHLIGSPGMVIYRSFLLTG